MPRPTRANMFLWGAPALLLLAGLAAIGMRHSTPPSLTIQLTDDQRQKFLAAPTTIEIDGTEFRLEAGASRNMMPHIGPSSASDSGLTAHFVIWPEGEGVMPYPPGSHRRRRAEPDPSSVPLPTIDPEEAWIVRGRTAWRTSRFQRDSSLVYRNAAVACIVRGGPEWPCRSPILIVVQVKAPDGTPHLLRTAPFPLVCAY